MAKKKRKQFHEYTMMQKLLPVEFSQGINPLTLLLENISFKHLFSTIFRKIGEDYHTNHFDTTISSFELKLGFGLYQANAKQVEQYYYYASLAHLNGWNVFSPSKIINLLQIIMIPMIDSFVGTHHIVSFSKALQLRCTALIYQIKVLPYSKPSQEMHWCVEGFFSLWQKIVSAEGKGGTLDTSLKEKLLQEHLAYFFLLYYVSDRFVQQQPYGNGILGLQKYFQQQKQVFEPEKVAKIIQDYHEHVTSDFWSDDMIYILNNMYPQENYFDSLIRLYPDEIGSEFFGKIFPVQELKQNIGAVMYGKMNLFQFMSRISSPTLLKDYFISAVRNFTSAIHNNLSYNHKDSQELQSFFESLQVGKTHLLFDIPKSLRKESELMNLLLHFYIHNSFGGFCYVPTIDTLYEICPEFVDAWGSSLILPSFQSFDEQQILQSILHQYTNNEFYYQYAYTKIILGSERFTIPLFPPPGLTLVEIQRLEAIILSHLPILIQDFIEKKQQQLASKKERELFQQLCSPDISFLLSQKKDVLLQNRYGPFFDRSLVSLLAPSEHSYSIFRDHWYELDTLCWRKLIEVIGSIPELKTVKHRGLQQISYAMMRQTLLGVMIFLSYVDQQTQTYEKKSFLIDILDEILVREVWLLPFPAMRKVSMSYRNLIEYYHPLIDILVNDEETQYMCSFGLQSLQIIVEKSQQGEVINIGHEDVVWFREYLKHLHYFSKKSYKPSL